MKKILTAWTVFGVAAVLASAAPAFAQVAGAPDNGSETLVSVGSNMGSVKDVALKSPLVETHIGMPGPYEPEPGPIAAGSEMMPTRGSAIVHPRGGTFVSPKQRADREIQRLIRKLG